MGGNGDSLVGVVGAGGLLGRALLATACRPVAPATRAECELTSPASVEAWLASKRPALVINAAAYTNVDGAESAPLEALAGNVTAPAVLARACAAAGVPLLHVSTDHVFDGALQRPYEVEDEPRPLSVYGLSKLGGEQWVRRLQPASWIVRTSGLFGAGGRNFVDAVATRARAGQPLRVVADQVCARTWSVDLAGALWTLVKRRPPFGYYHVTNAGHVSWYEFARRIVARLGVAVDVTPVTTAQWGAAAMRPSYSVLSDAAWRAAGLAPLRPEDEAVAAYLRGDGDE
jgi:dTDP-4-dehydrorhamnose reductase